MLSIVRAKLTIRKLLGLRRPYFFLSTLAHRLNFVVGLTTTAVWAVLAVREVGLQLHSERLLPPMTLMVTAGVYVLHV